MTHTKPRYQTEDGVFDDGGRGRRSCDMKSSTVTDQGPSDLVWGLIKCIGDFTEFLCQAIDLMIRIGLKFFNELSMNFLYF